MQKRGRGRPRYADPALGKAYRLYCQNSNLTVSAFMRLIHENNAIRNECGFLTISDIPSQPTFSRFFAKMQGKLSVKPSVIKIPDMPSALVRDLTNRPGRPYKNLELSWSAYKGYATNPTVSVAKVSRNATILHRTSLSSFFSKLEGGRLSKYIQHIMPHKPRLSNNGRLHRILPRKFHEPIVLLPEFYPFFTEQSVSDQQGLIETVNNVVPRTIREDRRQDICQDILLAILEGRININQLNDEVPNFIKQVNRQCPTKFGPLSLEAPLSSEDNRPLGDMLISPLPTPEELVMAQY